jgi:hypothetical protein
LKPAQEQGYTTIANSSQQKAVYPEAFFVSSDYQTSKHEFHSFPKFA